MTKTDRIKQFFFDRAPNSVLENIIFQEFVNIGEPKINQILEELVSEDFISREIGPPNPRHPAIGARKTYRITEKALGSFPIKTEIEAAGIKVNRLIDLDKARAEDINNLILSVNKLIDAKSNELERKIEQQNKKFWAALITIFALFISLFSIINAGVRPLLFTESLNLSPSALAYQSFLNIAPLTIVLLLFTWLLHKILK